MPRSLARNIDNCLILDGANDGVGFGDVFDRERTEKFSYSFWMYPRDLTSAQVIIQKRNNTAAGWEIAFGTTDQRLRLILEGSNGSAILANGPLMEKNRWYHVVITYSGNSLVAGVNYYINGIQSDAISIQNNLNTNISTAENMRIGLRKDNTNDYDGMITKIRFHTIELNQTQANNLYYNDNDEGTSMDGLYTFDEGSGGFIFNTAPGGGTATGVLAGGIAWSTFTSMKVRSLDSQARAANTQERTKITQERSVG